MRQHGVFARRQLLDLGIRATLIDHWLRDGRIETVERGVYALARALLSREGGWMAAVLAAGPDTVLSHASAAALWGIRPDVGPPSHVTAPRKLSRRPGLAVHCLPLAADERMSGTEYRRPRPGAPFSTSRSN